MIDPETGVISFERPPFDIGPDLTRTQFLAAPWSQGAKDWSVHEPYHAWKLAGTPASGDAAFLVILQFHGERLTMVELCDADPRYGTSWDDASLEKELARKASHDRWLTACLGDRRTFPWGEVWSEFDQRSSASSLGVRYGDKLAGSNDFA